MNHQVLIEPVAYISTDFETKFGIPRQSGLSSSSVGKIVFTGKFRTPEAVRELDGFSHIWLIFGFSECRDHEWHATVRPPRLGGNRRVGVFASRAPYRPNGLGLSCVRLESIEFNPPTGPILTVSGVDLLNGTPIYDIKPYIPFADCVPTASEGYTSETKRHRLHVTVSDEFLSTVDPTRQAELIEILSQDPRPGYQDNTDRIYGMRISGYEVKFTVENDCLTVTDLQKTE